MEKPRSYLSLSDDECRARIAAGRAALGSDLMLLVHHYQRREIVPFADALGDSYALSVRAAKAKARHIVFCGVHFMAESADILTSDDQIVYLPNPYAGCPMADMAPMRQVLAAWDDLSRVFDLATLVPIAYMNSAAELKAFTGRAGGLICTSANAAAAFDWACARGERLFFLPDEHLGRNTANAKGIPRDRILRYDPTLPLGGHTPEALRHARVLLWAGHCHVHMNFTREQVETRRLEFPGIRVIVHPECREEVVQAADVVGSTQTIVREAEQAPAGAVLAIGTELNLVARLIAQFPEKRILPLSTDQCPMCVNMFRTSLQDLAWTLDAIREGGGNIVRVDEAWKREARLALTRMLELAR